MNIVIGCDEAGFQLKQTIIKHLQTLGHTAEDFGCFSEDPVLYPEVAHTVAKAVAENKAERGILICGTGIGMCITANKVPGVRAAVCHDSYSTVRSRGSNDAQVMCMGARVIGAELAKQLVELWLQNDFGGGGSTVKVQKMNEIDDLYHKEI